VWEFPGLDADHDLGVLRVIVEDVVLHLGVVHEEEFTVRARVVIV
jgi:hypothetical protein